MKAELINAFIAGLQNTLTTMAHVTDVTRKGLHLEGDKAVHGDVSGVMGIGGNVSGSVALTSSMESIRILTGAMLSTPPAELNDDDIKDGMGELTNMVTGSAKTAMSDTAYKFDISIPTIITGKNHTVVGKSDTPKFLVIFDADGQEITLQVCLRVQD